MRTRLDVFESVDEMEEQKNADRDCDKSEEFLQVLFNQSPQGNHHDAELSCGIIFDG